MEILYIIGVVVVLNTSFMLWIFNFTRRFYTQRFDALTVMIKEVIFERDNRIKEAFDERDARFARLQAVLSETLIRDTRLFDSLTEDTESFPVELEIIDGHEENDTNGA